MRKKGSCWREGLLLDLLNDFFGLFLCPPPKASLARCTKFYFLSAKSFWWQFLYIEGRNRERNDLCY